MIQLFYYYLIVHTTPMAITIRGLHIDHGETDKNQRSSSANLNW